MKITSNVEDELLPIVLVLQSILGFLQLLDVLKLPYFPTINRLTRPKNFELDQSLVLPLLLLLGISITYVILKQQRKISLIPIISFLLYPYHGLEAALAIASLLSVITTIYVYREFKKYLFWTLLTISGINILSLLHWMLLTPLNVKTPIESLALLELDLFYIASYLAPLIILPLLFTWLIKYMIDWAWDSRLEGNMPHSKNTDKNTVYILLSSAVLLSVISSIYPYLTNINPGGLNIGVDIQVYVDWAKIVNHDITQAFNISGGSRPLIHLMIIFFKRLSGLSFDSTVRYLPAILNPLLVLSMFVFSYEMTTDLRIAAWASFFTATGYQITVNMYSYFLANILGLSLIFLSLGLLFRTIRKGDRKSLIAASALGSLLVYTHPWTFIQYYASIFVSTAISYYHHRKKGKAQEYLKPIVTYLALLAAAELVKSQLFNGYGGVAATSSVVNSLAGLNEFWFSSIYNFRLLFGGFMSNNILLILAIIGAYSIGHKKIHELFLTTLLALTTIVFLIGNEHIKARLLYNIPIGPLAALGFLNIHQRLRDPYIKHAFTIFTVSSMIAYLFQSLANLI